MPYVPGVRSDPITPAANGSAENPIPASMLHQSTFHQHLLMGNGVDIEGGVVTNVGNGATAALWITLPADSDYTIGTAAVLFSNPEATSHIEAWTFDDKDPEIHDGFTTLTKIDIEASGNMTIRMAKI